MVLGAVFAFAGAFPAGAQASGWTVTPNVASATGGLSSVSCVSSTFCAAVGNNGYAYTYDGSQWIGKDADGSVHLTSVSCVSSSLCVAGGSPSDTYAIWDGAGWTSHTFSDTAETIQSVSCLTARLFCMAIDGNGNSLTFNGSSWSALIPTNDQGNGVAVACVTSLFCEEVDSVGNVYTWTGSSWSQATPVIAALTPLYFYGVSCATASFCVAVDYNYAEATIGSGDSWSKAVQVDNVDQHPSLFSVSCPNFEFCDAGSGSGRVWTLTYDGMLGPMWTSTQVFNQSGALAGEVIGISCSSFSFCAAVDAFGDVAVYHAPPPPTVVTGQASSVTPTGATLNGTVNPNGSFVNFCYIDWGTSVQYGHIAACSPSPGTGNSPVPVLTTLSGLTPDTTYHFTVVASSYWGTGAGADETFTTGPLPPPPPTIGRLTRSHGAFKPATHGPSELPVKHGEKHGTVIDFVVNEAASVRFTIERILPGRISGRGARRRCVAPKLHGHRGHSCTRLVNVPGSFTVTAHPGLNAFWFTGWLAGSPLAPGSYELIATPQAAGTAGTPVLIAFHVKA